MKILSIDTANPILFLALSEGDTVLAKAESHGSGTHMKHIMTEIDEVLKQANIGVEEIDYYAASVGPGSFTGIRIGVATAQAMAMARDKRCIALNSLDAIAYAYIKENTLLVPMIEARNRRIYTKAFWGNEELMESQVIEVDSYFLSLRDKVKNEEKQIKKILFCGDETAERYANDEQVRAILLGEENEKSGLVIEYAEKMFYEAEVLAKLAKEKLDRNEDCSYQELLPEYFAPTQAERSFGFFVDEH